jgi:hypothetical protein
VARYLGRDLEHDERVRPGGEAAEPSKLIEPVKDVDEGVVGGLLSQVVELRTADRSELVAAARQLVDRDSLQHIMKAGDGLVVARVPDPELLDPPSRVRVESRFRAGARAAAARGSLAHHGHSHSGVA